MAALGIAAGVFVVRTIEQQMTHSTMSIYGFIFTSCLSKTKPLTLNMLGIARAILHCGFSSSSLRQKLQIPGPAVGMVSNVTHGVQRIDDALVSLAFQYTVNLDPDGLDLAFS